ncbi:hypothetical protein C8Q76DRAFT_241369 [Earliella scabrosa]|nr:hypothetical protein C8Q76DRAFT_241369 [Earliella scabrosa]
MIAAMTTTTRPMISLIYKLTSASNSQIGLVVRTFMSFHLTQRPPSSGYTPCERDSRCVGTLLPEQRGGLVGEHTNSASVTHSCTRCMGPRCTHPRERVGIRALTCLVLIINLLLYGRRPRVPRARTSRRGNAMRLVWVVRFRPASNPHSFVRLLTM